MGIVLGIGIIAGAQAASSEQLVLALVLVGASMSLAAIVGQPSRPFLLSAGIGCIIGTLAGMVADRAESPPISEAIPLPIHGRAMNDPQFAADGFWLRLNWTSPDGVGRTSRLTLPADSVIERGDRIAVHGRIDGASGDTIAATTVRVTERAGRVDRWRSSARAAIAASVQRYVPGSAGSLALGLLVGDDSAMTARERDDLRAAGLSHLTAVSGWNVSFVTATVGSMLLAFGRRGWRSASIQIAALVAFVWLVGADPPVLRAGIMGIAAIVATRLGRPAHAFTVLLLTAAVMVALSPTALTSLSFQLSLLATIGVVLGARWTEALPTAAKAVATPIVTTIIVGLTTAPVIALWFGTLTPAMVPANLIAAPLAAPATIVAVGVCLTAPLPLLPEVLGWSAWVVCSAILTTARICASLPFGQLTFAPISSESALALYAAGIVLLAAGLPEGRIAAGKVSDWAQREPQPAAIALLTLAGVLGVAVVTI